ncbi:hypothetical protein GCM10010912_15440 [Paenibacillus albidus]|uniref:DUF2809 domain-containing protein n=1 Tax=Paenibacillus albidus TaxID=2041023 RepID=A0A917FFL2_9BACL|nr:DUF2809 domain-containing protein [Paenibacillus albidus]GGF71173.1 hypothetical protein GCM10010912_15440 [Paenibacillus albidus]
MTDLKAKLVYLGAVLAAIVLGLLTRNFAEHLPRFVSLHFGDALWAVMIYCGFRLLWTRQAWPVAVILSLLFCFGIECSQLYQAEWINAWRATVLGGLILGKGFLWLDLVRYTAGIGAASLLDWCGVRIIKPRQ